MKPMLKLKRSEIESLTALIEITINAIETQTLPETIDTQTAKCHVGNINYRIFKSTVKAVKKMEKTDPARAAVMKNLLNEIADDFKNIPTAAVNDGYDGLDDDAPYPVQ